MATHFFTDCKTKNWTYLMLHIFSWYLQQQKIVWSSIKSQQKTEATCMPLLESFVGEEAGTRVRYGSQHSGGESFVEGGRALSPHDV